MNQRHTIRLHAAWKRVVCGAAGAAEQAATVSLPDSELARCEAPRVVYRRHFNRPTGIGEQTTVLLDCGLVPLASEVRLNGEPLTAPPDGLPEITGLLRPHNELEIVLAAERFAAASRATASLQIIDPA